jgi:hypothetical protein
MTAALYDEVVVTAAPTLHVVRDGAPIQTPAPKKAARPVNIDFSDPLVEGAARLLSIPLRHVYAVLWRVGVLEVRA